jgi:hypothetical protein
VYLDKKSWIEFFSEMVLSSFFTFKKFSIFWPDLFCGNNLNNRPVYHHGVQKAPEYLFRMWRILPGTSVVGLIRRFCSHSCCLRMYSAFWLRGMLRNVSAHWYSPWMRTVLALQR